MPPNQQIPNQQFPNQQFPNQQLEAGSNNIIQNTPDAPKNPNSTQNTLLLSEIRENMVIMTDGTFRAVIACQPINFDLMNFFSIKFHLSYSNFLE